MGVPPVIIHILVRFSIVNHPALGVPPLMETPISSIHRDSRFLDFLNLQ